MWNVDSKCTNTTSPKAMKNVIDISCFVMFGVLIAAIDADSGRAASPPAPSTLDQQVNNWLEDLSRGRSGTNHWLAPANDQPLSAVKSWEIVESSAFGRIVRIESSDAAGAPLVALWQIVLDDGKIVSVHRK